MWADQAQQSGFFKEKIALVVCLAHGTGFPSQSCVVSPIPATADLCLLVAAAWCLDVFVINQELPFGAGFLLRL